MSTLDLSLLLVCPHCHVRVLPRLDGLCPSCREPIWPGTSTKALADVLEQGADDDEQINTPHALPSAVEDVFEEYIQAVHRIRILRRRIVAGFAIVGSCILIALILFGLWRPSIGIPNATIIRVGAGCAILAICLVVGGLQAKQRVQDEISLVALNRPGFEDFYDIFTRTPFWSSRSLYGKRQEVFMTLIERRPPV